MTNQEFKQQCIERLFSRGVITRKVSDIKFNTRCPLCGDSNNPRKMHFGLLIDCEHPTPILYNCFKCSRGGVLSKEVAQALGFIQSNEDENNFLSYSKSCSKYDTDYFKTGTTYFFVCQIPEVKRDQKIAYIEDRLNTRFSNQELKDMKVITSLREFLMLNKIKTITEPASTCRILERDYVGFLNTTGTHIYFRDTTGRNKFKWYDYRIFTGSFPKKFFSIASSVYVLTPEPIEINLSEGVFDCLSIWKNLDHVGDNVINIAVGGKRYASVLDDLISMGFVGSNITINIFSDDDGTYDTSMKFYKEKLQLYKYLYGKISVHYNILSKDVGVPADQIALKSYTV